MSSDAGSMDADRDDSAARAERKSKMLAAAQDSRTTPFDYIVIGSGAGGGSLAARLAESEQGVRVLVIEAGGDPGVPDAGGDPAVPGAGSAINEVYEVPGYHAAATEDPSMCWGFSVRHYADDPQQRKDPKYDAKKDPSAGDDAARDQPAQRIEGGQGDAGGQGAPGGERDKGGILYPRSSGLGGCTGHFAMIVVKPNDCDWDQIADITGDESWSAARMQAYFARIENCLYYQSYQGFLRKFLLFYRGLARLVGFVDPSSQLDTGGHGFGGWQKTSFIDPELVVKIAWGDRTFLRVLLDVFRFLWTRPGQIQALLGSLLRLQPVQFLDPNFGIQRGRHSGRTAFIPIATDGARRFGLRERLLAVERAHPERLVIASELLATRIIFRGDPGQPPRAVGVEVQAGAHLYEASPRSHESSTPSRTQAGAADPHTLKFYARREIIVAGGAFNTPQLLMLSGIGDRAHLRELGIEGPRDAGGAAVSDIVPLPGVGQNLQDRYEVSVISETDKDFSTLRGVTFKPGDGDDPARRQWMDHKQGLYATNGGAVSFFYETSQATNGEPDLFIFGAPAAFRGYYWGWSKELLHARKGSSQDQRNLWSWILLKAYSRNRGGSVQLRTPSPRSQPQITFHSFSEGCAPMDADADVKALAEGVEFLRTLNGRVSVFTEEIQPGPSIDGAALPDWIQNEAWGHHACGTCRMGSEPWQADARALQDAGAVLDSEFRVHGVRALRVVDTSAFPRIPGYFIVTPTFMIGEKAADTLLADCGAYPRKLEAAEAEAIRTRRRRTRLPDSLAALESESTRRLPADTIGLALSGGGVRSATFCLGVLQGLARKGLLRRIDILASVSGGGYIAAFLGRLYTRMTEDIANPGRRVEETISDINSAEIWWLRSHARYLTGAGRTDLETDLGTVWRNLLSVHVSVALLVLAGELLLCGVGLRDWVWAPPRLSLTHPAIDLTLSPWWWIPLAVLLLGVVPCFLGFWLAPKPGTTASLSLGNLPIWLLGLLGSVVLLTQPAAFSIALVMIVVLLLAWVWQEAALWRVDTSEKATRGIIARNRLTRSAGITVQMLGAATLWVVLDTFADWCAKHSPELPTALMGLVAACLPAFRTLVTRLGKSGAVTPGSRSDSAGEARRDQKAASLTQTLVLGAIAFALVAFLIFGLDVLAHWAFLDTSRGWWLFAAAAVLSVAIGRATGFVNLSSLESLYAARLARTYLGAANEQRTRASDGSDAKDVDAAHPGDDLFLHDYHPEAHGGPLHLINVCVNETVDVTSGRQLEEDKGLPMCLGPLGVSVGVKYHALWDAVPASRPMRQRMLWRLEHPDEDTSGGKKSALTALPTGPDPGQFHVLARRGQPTVAVEPLRLSEWTAISGAAVSTGDGRLTSVPTALLLGLFNVRLGYWWNTGIGAGERPSRYPPSLWRRFKALPGYIFRAQSTILNEWRGYFAGPSQKLWYLTDGGHSENTGLYELIRRRVPFMLAVDADEDPGYGFDDMALLVRRVRLDFGAEVHWIDPTPAHAGAADWQSIAQACGAVVPATVRQWIDPTALGRIDGFARRGSFAAALARIDYTGPDATSWLVVVKASLASPPAIPLDVECYAKQNDAFPNQSTVDQFFTDDQWESYRLLGETLTGRVIR